MRQDSRNGDGRLGDHWTWRPQWRADRPHLMWYLTFGYDEPLHDWLRRARDCLAGEDRLDAVPEQWLHCTLDDVGFVDEMPSEQVDLVAQAGEAALHDRSVPALDLGPAEPMREALVLRTEPAGELSALRDALRGATASVLGARALPELEAFEPHVSFAYANRPVDAGPLMARLRCIAPARLHVVPPAVTLASVTRRDRHYQWTTRREVLDQT